MRRFLLLLVAVGTATPATSAIAQDIRSSPLIVDRGRADRVQPRTGHRSVAKPELKPAAPRIASATIEAAPLAIGGVIVEGDDVPAVVKASGAGFVGKPATKEVITALATAVSDAYAKTDIAYHTIVVLGQEPDTGVLHLRAVHGFVQSYVIEGKGGRQRRRIDAYVRPLLAQHPLRRSTLDRYLELIDDIPGLDVAASAVSGTVDGAIVLHFAVTPHRVRAAFGFDNRASDLLGRQEAQVAVEVDGLLRGGDQTSVFTSGLIHPGKYKYIAGAYATPIGANGAQLSLSAGHLRSRIYDGILTGKATTLGLQFSYPLVKRSGRDLTATAALDGIDSDNAILGQVYALEHTRAARLALSFSDTAGRHDLTLGVTLSQGLPIFHAWTTQPLSQRSFRKINLRAGLDRAIGKHLVGRVRAIAQYTTDRLPSAESFSVGGAEFGRAFENAAGYGDSGYAGVAEVAWVPTLPKAVNGSRLYAFTDYGHVSTVDRGPYFPGARYDLASVGAGLRMNYKGSAAIDLSAARAIERPEYLVASAWRFSVDLRMAVGG